MAVQASLQVVLCSCCALRALDELDVNDFGYGDKDTVGRAQLALWFGVNPGWLGYENVAPLKVRRPHLWPTVEPTAVFQFEDNIGFVVNEYGAPLRGLRTALRDSNLAQPNMQSVSVRQVSSQKSKNRRCQHRSDQFRVSVPFA